VSQFNQGKWSEARMRSFAMSAIRRAQWPVKYAAIATAYIANGVNPATGKPCKLHRCTSCKKTYPKGMMRADHINPVIPIDNNWKDGENWLGYNWNQLLPRLWCEADNYQIICKDCHKEKSKDENTARRKAKTSTH